MYKMTKNILFAFFVPVFAAGCASNQGPNIADDDTGTGTGTGADADADADTDTDSDSETMTGTTCDEQGFKIVIVPVRMMILEDISLSMDDPLTTGGDTKWEVAKQSLQNSARGVQGQGDRVRIRYVSGQGPVQRR